MPRFLVATVHVIEGEHPTMAWEKFTETLEGVLFATGPIVANDRQIDDPDFDVRVFAGTVELERAEPFDASSIEADPMNAQRRGL